MAEWLILSGMTPEEVQELVEDHLQQQLLKHFDISKADEIVSNVSQIPSWLRKMFEYKKWRQLFYKLIEEHPESVFLKFAIKLITDAGYQGEITNLTTAASQLPVFARVIKTSLEMLLSSSDEDIQEKLPKFCEMVNHTEHTYLFTQSLLAEIQEKSLKSYLVTRISQEVELFARTRGHSVDAVWYGSIPGATR
jgi:negative elongation factor C/D